MENNEHKKIGENQEVLKESLESVIVEQESPTAASPTTLIDDESTSHNQVEDHASRDDEASRPLHHLIDIEEDGTPDKKETDANKIRLSDARHLYRDHDGEKNNEGIERHWYAIHTYSGYEDAVARYLNQRIDSLAMHDKIFQVVVPKEKKIKIKNGKRRSVEEKIYPGYVLVDMYMTEDTWYVVRNTPRVTRFVGSETTRPVPLARKDVDLLLSKMETKDAGFAIDLEEGDAVKIIDGPFKEYDAKVSEIDEERGKVKVLVQIFGRDTLVELDSLQVQKI